MYNLHRQFLSPEGLHSRALRLQYLVKENHLEDKVELGGTFCMGNCVNGVNVTVDDKLFSVSPETTKDFFEKEILAKVK